MDYLNKQGEALLSKIENANLHGLDPETYNLKEITRLQQEVFSGELPSEEVSVKYVQLDFLLTAAYLTHASHMFTGILNPEKADSNWVMYAREKDWDAYLQKCFR